jgi:hypothetical protein
MRNDLRGAASERVRIHTFLFRSLPKGKGSEMKLTIAYYSASTRWLLQLGGLVDEAPLALLLCMLRYISSRCFCSR